ncbi:hypothetical protein PT974_08188 [Cladobotryum mycophilum]|uniref:Erythromycin esterase n=1 Tax=Cladobotryum mycophilum TaxID=491253 RepID=A0ABR0SDQ1_9HYPO
MSPVTRRRSARLAGTVSKSKPAAPELDSVTEQNESPVREAPKRRDVAASPLPTPATPASSALRPPRTEMHPSKFQSTILAPSSALRLGFTDIKTNKRRDSMHGSGLESTPTKMGGVPSSAFSFRVDRSAPSASLSGDAQRMMEEFREDALKIKADLIAQRETDESSNSSFGGRTFAKPKSKTGRFSAAHMAEFKKMDSIEGHASAWRAQKGRFTPVRSNLKRTPSKANLDTTPTPHKSNSKQSLVTTSSEDIQNSRPKLNLKRKPSIANLDNRPPSAKKTDAATPSKDRTLAKEAVSFPTKRLKQKAEDDASSGRPVSRDGSSIPQPTFSAKKPRSLAGSSISRLMSPTKSTVSLVAPSPKPSNVGESKPEKPEIAKTTEPIASEPKTLDGKRRIISPGRFSKVKSILRGQKTDSDNSHSGIPHPVAFQSQTPAPLRTNKVLPPVPLTTPRRKLAKHVTFTPEAVRVAMDQDSPSPQKFGFIGKAKSLFNLEDKKPAGLDSVSVKAKSGDVAYPDLSSFKHLIEPESKTAKEPEPSVPGTFTFRSDHTIDFGSTSPTGFGASPGQSSIRHVRSSIKPSSDMPGSFPNPLSSTSHPNKENAAPSPPKVLTGAPHGMSNKKRHRASSVDSDMVKEGDERAAKKRKQDHVAEKETPATPKPLGSTPAKKMRLDRPLGHTPGRTPARPLGRTPGRTPSATASATPAKKRAVFDMSRLNMLARPKHRAERN